MELMGSGAVRVLTAFLLFAEVVRTRLGAALLRSLRTRTSTPPTIRGQVILAPAPVAEGIRLEGLARRLNSTALYPSGMTQARIKICTHQVDVGRGSFC